MLSIVFRVLHSSFRINYIFLFFSQIAFRDLIGKTEDILFNGMVEPEAEALLAKKPQLYGQDFDKVLYAELSRRYYDVIV